MAAVMTRLGRRGFALLGGGVLLLALALLFGRVRSDPALAATVGRGTLSVRLTESGVLKPASSMTYRSPLGGRESEIVFLVAEGTLVGEGDLLIRLDTTELERERVRAVRDLRQVEVDLKLAEAEREDGVSDVDSVVRGQRSLELEETRAQLALAERKAERLTKEHAQLESLRQRGFATQDELDEATFAMEQATSERELARRKAATLEQSQPRNRLRAELQLAQKEAQRENVRARVREAREQLKTVGAQIEGCSLHARAAGLVVYEDFLGAGQRRKIRAGDRVTGTQGLVTIPEVTRMVVEASVPESEVHRVGPGQAASVRLDAFPDRLLPGRVSRVGTLARSSEGALSKRFDVVVELERSSPDLRPEMSARVEILVAEKQGVILVPVNAIFDREGVHVCHVLGLFGPRTRRVAIGDSNDLFAEALSGVSEGDRLSLLDLGAGAAPPGEALPAREHPRDALAGSDAKPLAP
jgi:multidrug efflux pump subunit AcrA (membrane-fusion protein)